MNKNSYYHQHQTELKQNKSEVEELRIQQGNWPLQHLYKTKVISDIQK